MDYTSTPFLFCCILATCSATLHFPQIAAPGDVIKDVIKTEYDTTTTRYKLEDVKIFEWPVQMMQSRYQIVRPNHFKLYMDSDCYEYYLRIHHTFGFKKCGDKTQKAASKINDILKKAYNDGAAIEYSLFEDKTKKWSSRHQVPSKLKEESKRGICPVLGAVSSISPITAPRMTRADRLRMREVSHVHHEEDVKTAAEVSPIKKGGGKLSVLEEWLKKKAKEGIITNYDDRKKTISAEEILTYNGPKGPKGKFVIDYKFIIEPGVKSINFFITATKGADGYAFDIEPMGGDIKGEHEVKWEVFIRELPDGQRVSDKAHSTWLSGGTHMSVSKLVGLTKKEITGTLVINMIFGLVKQWGVTHVTAEDAATYHTEDVDGKYYPVNALIYRSIRNQLQFVGAGKAPKLLPSMYMKWGFVFANPADYKRCTEVAELFSTVTYKDLASAEPFVKTVQNSGVFDMTTPEFGEITLQKIMLKLYNTKHIVIYNMILAWMDDCMDDTDVFQLAKFYNLKLELDLRSHHVHTAHQDLDNEYEDLQDMLSELYMRGYKESLSSPHAVYHDYGNYYVPNTHSMDDSTWMLLLLIMLLLLLIMLSLIGCICIICFCASVIIWYCNKTKQMKPKHVTYQMASSDIDNI